VGVAKVSYGIPSFGMLLIDQGNRSDLIVVAKVVTKMPFSPSHPCLSPGTGPRWLRRDSGKVYS
jgi:hypothetical protein